MRMRSIIHMKSRILIHELNFLQRFLSDDAEDVAASALHALMDDPYSICIVREFRELEAAEMRRMLSSVEMALWGSKTSRKRFFWLTELSC